jgi:hypothetical protein
MVPACPLDLKVPLARYELRVSSMQLHGPMGRYYSLFLVIRFFFMRFGIPHLDCLGSLVF